MPKRRRSTPQPRSWAVPASTPREEGWTVPDAVLTQPSRSRDGFVVPAAVLEGPSQRKGGESISGIVSGHEARRKEWNGSDRGVDTSPMAVAVFDRDVTRRMSGTGKPPTPRSQLAKDALWRWNRERSDRTLWLHEITQQGAKRLTEPHYEVQVDHVVSSERGPWMIVHVRGGNGSRVVYLPLDAADGQPGLQVRKGQCLHLFDPICRISEDQWYCSRFLVK